MVILYHKAVAINLLVAVFHIWTFEKANKCFFYSVLTFQYVSSVYDQCTSSLALLKLCNLLQMKSQQVLRSIYYKVYKHPPPPKKNVLFRQDKTLPQNSYGKI